MLIARLLLLCFAVWGLLSAETRYVIDLAEAKAGWLTVTAETTCQRQECDFQIPVWSAIYQVRDFAQFVERFHAVDENGAPVSVRKVNPSLWRVEGVTGQAVRLRYRVLADRPGPFGAYAGPERVSLNLAQVLVYPVDSRHREFTLRFLNRPASWKEALELSRQGDTYTASSYDQLIDTPVLLAAFDEVSFEHGGKTFRIVAHGSPGSYDLDLLEDAARRLVAAAAELMGSAPFTSYTFVYQFAEVAGGGMEFSNGAVIHVSDNCKRCDYTALTAHELFHAWNVKRIRPRSLEPVDFTQPNITPSLWFSEGVTSTYAQFLRLKAAFANESDLLAHLGRLITDYEARPASRAQSAEESSIDAWLERYPAYGRPERSVSYYLKGELIGYLLDLTIRQRSRNRRSLDDAMRRLNTLYAERGRYFEDTDALRTVMSEVAESDLSGVFDELVRSAAPIDWDHYFAIAGYKLAVTGRWRNDAGLTLRHDPEKGVVISAVTSGGAAEQAGIRRGDRIVSIDGRSPGSDIERIQQRLERRAERRVKIEILRREGISELEVTPRKVEEKVYTVVNLEQPTPLQLAVRRGWLERTTVEPSAEPATSH